MKPTLSLFLTGFAQVLLVALNTWLIGHDKCVAVVAVGFLISLVWSLNVKRIAFGSWRDRLTYASGAGCGSGAGLLLAHLLYL